MAIGTKRKRGPDGSTNNTAKSECPVKKDLLVQCYNRVQTLRQYLQAKLPSSSRLRRKKVANIGLGEEEPTELEASKGDESYVTISGSPQAMSFAQSEVKTLKSAPWPQVLALLGQSGEGIIIDLLVDSSIFIAVDAGYGNYFQSPPEQSPPEETDAAKRQNYVNALKIAMYVFPRQFRLHNAFTSHVDWKTTAQKFQDYTLREAEVRLAKAPMAKDVALPQAQTRKRSKKAGRSTQPALTQLDYKSITDLASPTAHVSAFCQAALSKVVPDGFWGANETLKHNKRTFLRKVDHFIKLRRFETMSLHEIVQDFKVVDIAWLHQRHLGAQKTSQTDINKRYEIFHEFLYYVFDSLLIPLIRSNFYVTESSTHRYRVFYYRHDVWRRVAEPATAALKENMLEEVKTADASRVLSSRGLGFSHLRLLPKGQGVRPIMNLRRRQMQANGGALRPSINTVLGPVHTLLKLEKIKGFKQTLKPGHGMLYFAKLDVHAAFDTIPQEAVIRLMATVPQKASYNVAKHAEIKPGERAIAEANKTATKPIRRWHATALRNGEFKTFHERLEEDLGQRKKNTVFVASAAHQQHNRSDLLSLLAEHVSQHLVKIGKKYYRQKTGIPQGSVLSSFLCNYLYADLEIHHLDFLGGEDCLLLRLIDDFLLITLDRSKAERFVETMHRGLPDYGVQVSAAKTLVNFEMALGGEVVSQVGKGAGFPYCGVRIDTKTLEISKDIEREKKTAIGNSLTVEYGRSPGQNFERKVLGKFPGNQIHGEDRTIIKLSGLALRLLTGRSRKLRNPEYQCDIRRGQVAMAAYEAFAAFLRRKQTKYTSVLAWLDEEAGRLRGKTWFSP
ncbi:uncharacterized protein J7T54_006014 [Emericellopsis cladophorae]|uniref:Telomerase reverse transcriptase n=1 Tax=Emericellopsis cladophorae TaxID=2686198 RepID=A0A9P9Y9B4_9HYPO|nr:uncharacterized protein J7T54_006014 [Emericellopsis cladophorae]KAI6785680.1 hypothetical protein J7T54_006014 [Emericellopsis cladophorae]